MIRVLAPAKLTWSLEITGTRPDGYHLIRAEMVTLDLADELTIEDADTTLVEWPRWVAYAPEPTERNTIETALELVGRTAHVRLDKRIPVQGGLGGGSADAAAILRWAGFSDLAGAATIGADVPFCVVGGRAIVTGVGEIVEPLEFIERTVTLIVPSNLRVSTHECYRAYDDLIARGHRPSGRNHLREAACSIEPRLGETLEWLARETGLAVQLCGSGSTMFVDGDVFADVTNGPLAQAREVRSELGGGRLFDSPVGTLMFVTARTTPAMD